MSPTASWVATIGVSSLALWGTPLLWISGSQDLWMLALGLCFLVLIADRRDLLALPVLILALLSKETAAVFPGIGLAHMLLVARDGWATSLRRSAPFLVATALWAWWHPTLWTRLTSPLLTDRELLHRPSQLGIATKNLLACFNLSLIPLPTEVSLEDVLLAVLSAVALVLALLLARRLNASDTLRPAGQKARHVLAFIAVWIVLGWIPSHLPSIGWHAYYASVGVLAVWAGIALLAASRQVVLVPVIAALALLRGADAKTPSWDWGNEWYLQRAGSLLSAIEDKLRTEHPLLPHHTRVFFARLPNNIGLVAGRSAALRIWYRDSTLNADFYSNYRPRATWMAPGQDLFFRFDTLQILTEVRSGPEDIATAVRRNPEWADDHTKLAMLFLAAGQPSFAADQFEKIARLPGHPEAVLFGGACRELAGQTQRAESLYVVYGNRLSLSADSVRHLAAELIRTAPQAEDAKGGVAK